MTDPAFENPAITSLRTEVRYIWGTVLEPGTFDDQCGFFDSGGTSVDMVKLLSGLNARFPNTFNLIDLFHKPSIDSQARHIFEIAQSGSGVVPPQASSRQRLAEMRRASRSAQQEKEAQAEPLSETSSYYRRSSAALPDGL